MQNDKLRKVGQLYLVLLLAVFATAPFFIMLNSVSIVALALVWLLLPKSIRFNKFSICLIAVVVSYYLAHVYGLVISENKAAAGFILEKKMGLLILPLLIATGPIISKIELKKTFGYYTHIMLASSIFFVFFATYSWFMTGNSSAFFYHNLTANFDVHAVYYSYAICIALLFRFHCFLHDRSKWHLIYLTTFLIFLLLLASKTILIASALSIIIMVFNKGIKINKRSLSIFVGLTIVTFLVFGNTARERFNELKMGEVYSHDKKDFKYNSAFNGFNLRVVLWSIAADIQKENNAWLTGVGTGDAQTALNNQYKTRGMYVGNPELGDTGYLGYNPHNQYIQDWLGSGIFGVMSLLAILILAVIMARGLPLYIVFSVMIFALFFITESALERQAGSILFAILIGIILNQSRQLNSPKVTT